jgi:hypothetical protein
MSKATALPKAKRPPIKAGQRYGRLVAIEFACKSRTGCHKWQFQCDCGRIVVSISQNVLRGLTQSCGCLHAEISSRPATHGMSKTREYSSWSAMRARCTNPKAHQYIYYGERGITIADRWNSFEAFYSDMGPRPPKTTLDRIENDGNYEPGSCRWATRREQRRNRRDTKKVSMHGRTISVAEAAESLGLQYRRLKSRMRSGMSFDEATALDERKCVVCRKSLRKMRSDAKICSAECRNRSQRVPSVTPK